MATNSHPPHAEASTGRPLWKSPALIFAAIPVVGTFMGAAVANVFGDAAALGEPISSSAFLHRVALY